ncbi:hypothetical protein [Bacteroides graminisolvens]|nr:hypothetical protein [Bacteroides graminisolvens]
MEKQDLVINLGEYRIDEELKEIEEDLAKNKKIGEKEQKMAS